MNLSEVFDQLTYGELAQISIGGGAEGQIDDANYKAMVAHTNLGLTALYKRFPIKENSLMLSVISNKDTYVLTPENATSNNELTGNIKYILDSIDSPFIGDILKVEKVVNSYGIELVLNNDGDLRNIKTPTYNTIKFSKDLLSDLAGSNVEVVYRANHPIINVGNGAFNPENVELELPYSYLEPLLLFIASRINNPMGMTNEFHAGNSYAAKYELACQMLEKTNLMTDIGSEFNKIRSGGWV